MQKDIESRQDVELMIRSFYGKVVKDEILKPFFAGIDMEGHFPIMINFWSSILFEEHSYTGNAFEKHLKFNLQKEHFDTWLGLFNSTINEHFTGPTAERAKQRAYGIATIFQSKLYQIKGK